MKRFSRRTWILVVGVVVAAVASIGAYAYWTTSDGSGTGTATTGTTTTGLHVTQTSDTGPALSPGGTSQVLGGTVESTIAAGGANVFVKGIKATLATPTGGSNTPRACSTSDYQFVSSGGWTISTTATTNDTATRNDLNANLAPGATTPWSSLEVKMINKTDTVPGDGLGNQDGCKTATVNVNYNASATAQ